MGLDPGEPEYRGPELDDLLSSLSSNGFDLSEDAERLVRRLVGRGLNDFQRSMDSREAREPEPPHGSFVQAVEALKEGLLYQLKRLASESGSRAEFFSPSEYSLTASVEAVEMSLAGICPLWPFC
jgi:hypothetical protein